MGLDGLCITPGVEKKIAKHEILLSFFSIFLGDDKW